MEYVSISYSSPNDVLCYPDKWDMFPLTIHPQMMFYVTQINGICVH